jgi:hypothetical protein
VPKPTEEPPPPAAPSHRIATLRATSASSPPATYPAAIATYPVAVRSPPPMGFYEPLQDQENSDNDNPFHVDSEEEDELRSPTLLSEPINNTTVDAAKEVKDATDANVAAVEDNGGAGEDPGSASQTPPAIAASETTAAIMANFALIVERWDAAFALLLEKQRDDFALLVEKHSSALNRRMDKLHSTTNSNHGHITKRLFPALEAKIASLETLLATTANELEAEGVSLLATVTALDDKVSTAVEERLTSLESTVASPQVSTLRASRPREPPDDALPAGMAAFPGCVAVLGGDNDQFDSTPVDGPVDINARTRLAYNHARALNTPPRPLPQHIMRFPHVPRFPPRHKPLPQHVARLPPSAIPTTRLHNPGPPYARQPSLKPLATTVAPACPLTLIRPLVHAATTGVLVAIVPLWGGPLSLLDTAIRICAPAPLVQAGTM